MGYYRLLAGQHIQDGVTYNQGDRVESDEDLVARYGKIRFEKADAPRGKRESGSTKTPAYEFKSGTLPEAPSFADDVAESDSDDTTPEATGDQLDSYSIPELKQLAASKGIETRRLRTKEDLVAAIRARS